MPEAFQWPLLVTIEPPLAEHHLSKEHHETYQQTNGLTAIWSEIQSKREIDDGSNDGLRDIVGQTHATVKTEIGYSFLKILVLKKEYEGRYQNESERQLLPHIEYRTYRLLNHRTSFHYQVLQRMERRKTNSTNN